jgi:hypothetical protein
VYFPYLKLEIRKIIIIIITITRKKKKETTTTNNKGRTLMRAQDQHKYCKYKTNRNGNS